MFADFFDSTGAIDGGEAPPPQGGTASFEKIS